MKVLLGLLLIWLSLTVILGYSNLMYQEEAEFAKYRRAFVAYTNAFAGCLAGSQCATGQWTSFYPQCRDLAFKTKAEYLKR